MVTRILALLLILAGVGVAQQNPFAGTWEARYQGVLFCVIVVEDGEKFTGTLSCGSIRVNEEGDLTEVGPLKDDGAAALQNGKVDGPKLSFEIEDGAEIMKLRLIVTGERRAELHFVGLPKKIKPIPFGRSR